MNNFKKYFDSCYQYTLENNLRMSWDDSELITLDPYTLKMESLSSEVFGFTTYDSKMDVLLSERMIEVLECILNWTTFAYIKDPDNYINYITMVNMPFLKGSIDWWTSIRWAFFWLTHKSKKFWDITVRYDELE